MKFKVVVKHSSSPSAQPTSVNTVHVDCGSSRSADIKECVQAKYPGWHNLVIASVIPE